MRTYHYRGYLIQVALDSGPALTYSPNVRFDVWINGEIAAWTADPWDSAQRIIDYRIATRQEAK